MSNVRPSCMNTNSALSYAARASFQSSSPIGTLVPSPPLGLRSRFARAVRASPAGAPPALCRERANPSRPWAGPLVQQSIQNRAFVHALCFVQEKVPSSVLHKVPRSCTRRCPSTAAVRHAVSKAVALQRPRCRQPRPNPSVEGTAKRLRLLSAPHLER